MDLTVVKSYYIYHICREGDKGDLTTGYVGITIDPERRWKEHQKKGNPHLKAALAKYDDIVFTIISVGCQSEIQRMELWLRPTKSMGWNIMEGGGLPPDWKGKKRPASFGKAVGDRCRGKKQDPAIIATRIEKRFANVVHKFIAPDGVVHTCNNIAKFHRDTPVLGLDSLKKLAGGHYKQVKGWRYE